MKKQITTQTRERLERLIDKVREKFSDEELTEAFMDKLDGWEERLSVIQVLLLDANFKDEIKEEVSGEILEGRMVIEGLTLDKEMMLTEFINANIFPYYNQQNLLIN